MARHAAAIAVLLLVGAACGGGAGDTTTAPPATAAPTTTTPAATSATQRPPPTTTTTTTSPTTVSPEDPGPDADIVDGSLPIDAGHLIYGANGIVALTTSGELIRITPDATAVAIAVGDSLVVSQGGHEAGDWTRLTRQGPIRIHEPDGVREIPLAGDERMSLFDAGTADGSAVIVATSWVGSGWDSEEHLLLIDVASGQRTDLGVVGHYEAGVEAARLGGDVIVVKAFGQEQLLEARRLTGSAAWTVDGPSDFENPGFIVVAGPELLLVNPGFVDPNFTPVVEITRFDLATGEETSVDTLQLDYQFGGGFCHRPDWDGIRLVCEESYGGPVTVDPTTGSVAPLSSLESGSVSVARAVAP